MTQAFNNNWQVDEIKERFGRHFESEIEVLSTFPVMHSGWECDELGWVIRVERTNHVEVVLTNHGSFYLATEEELKKNVEEYEDVLLKTKNALMQLQMLGK